MPRGGTNISATGIAISRPFRASVPGLRIITGLHPVLIYYALSGLKNGNKSTPDVQDCSFISPPDILYPLRMGN